MTDKKTVFSAADILLPPYGAKDDAWQSYAVIACDQYTGEPEYWEKARDIAGDSLSTLGLIIPEAYLNTPLEKVQSDAVAVNMKSAESALALHENCLVYIERTLPDGRVRRGLVGKLDLEAYDFSPDSSSLVRATEETVVSRIPPRVAVRKQAPVELPHVMVFANDTKKLLLEPLSIIKSELEPLYDFTLMLGGGSICGYKIAGEQLKKVENAICEYESCAADGLMYAMGDGNHSLASAKAHFENIKKEKGDAAMEHPARYALVEIVDIYDDSIEFEPIYRLLLNCDGNDFLSYVEKRLECKEIGGTVTAIFDGIEKEITLPRLHALTVGSLQIIIDDYLKEKGEVECDYIHGVDSLRKLSEREGNVGFLCGGVEKDELFPYVAKNGTLPRKTFSMGEAASKRYYIEARKIQK